MLNGLLDITFVVPVSGNPHSELLKRLVENCLDSHYRLLILE